MKHLLIGLFLLVPSFASGQAFTVENPAPGGTYSGIGALTGWRCTGNNITFVFDTGLIVNAGYGTNRNDTIGACGDANNGFAALINFNLLGDGQHTVSVRNDNVQFAAVTFNVKTLGAEFLTGKSSSVQIANFPNAGQTTTMQWQQSSQNFVITNVTGGGVPNASGLWSIEATFFAEDCALLSPSDFPSSFVDTLSVNQSGGNLTATSGSLSFSGTLDPNGDFALVTPPDPTTAGGCTFGLTTGLAGNFLEGDLVTVFILHQISGSCPSLPCSVILLGSITDLSTAATTAERKDTGSSVSQIAERLKAAARQ